MATLPVAVPEGSKKSLPAATAEAATSVVLASVPMAVFSAVFRLAAVAAGVAPMVKLPVGGGDALDAVNETEAVVPSGRLKVRLSWSPGLGLVAGLLVPSVTDSLLGEPDGPVTVAPVSDDDTELNFRPNGEPATSSATETVVGVGGVEVVLGPVITRRPRPVVPSACARSDITCFNPA